MQAGARPVSQPPAPTDLAGDSGRECWFKKMDGSSDQPLSVSKSDRTLAPLGLELSRLDAVSQKKIKMATQKRM